MPVRYYFCDWVGSGTRASPCRPRCRDLVPSARWKASDGRADGVVSGGDALCWADVTDAQHATLTGNVNVKYLPAEDASGNPLPTTARVGDIPPAQRQACTDEMEARHVPTDDFGLGTRLWRVWRRVCQRHAFLRMMLKADDFTEAFTALVSSIPSGKRANIRAKLEALGFDMSDVQLSDTVRQALKKLLAQNNPWMRTPFDGGEAD